MGRLYSGLVLIYLLTVLCLHLTPIEGLSSDKDPSDTTDDPSLLDGFILFPATYDEDKLGCDVLGGGLCVGEHKSIAESVACWVYGVLTSLWKLVGREDITLRPPIKEQPVLPIRTKVVKPRRRQIPDKVLNKQKRASELYCEKISEKSDAFYSPQLPSRAWSSYLDWSSLLSDWVLSHLKTIPSVEESVTSITDVFGWAFSWVQSASEWLPVPPTEFLSSHTKLVRYSTEWIPSVSSISTWASTSLYLSELPTSFSNLIFGPIHSLVAWVSSTAQLVYHPLSDTMSFVIHFFDNMIQSTSSIVADKAALLTGAVSTMSWMVLLRYTVAFLLAVSTLKHALPAEGKAERKKQTQCIAVQCDKEALASPTASFISAAGTTQPKHDGACNQCDELPCTSKVNDEESTSGPQRVNANQNYEQFVFKSELTSDSSTSRNLCEISEVTIHTDKKLYLASAMRIRLSNESNESRQAIADLNTCMPSPIVHASDNNDILEGHLDLSKDIELLDEHFDSIKTDTSAKLDGSVISEIGSPRFNSSFRDDHSLILNTSFPTDYVMTGGDSMLSAIITKRSPYMEVGVSFCENTCTDENSDSYYDTTSTATSYLNNSMAYFQEGSAFEIAVRYVLKKVFGMSVNYMQRGPRRWNVLGFAGARRDSNKSNLYLVQPKSPAGKKLVTLSSRNNSAHTSWLSICQSDSIRNTTSLEHYEIHVKVTAVDDVPVWKSKSALNVLNDRGDVYGVQDATKEPLTKNPHTTACNASGDDPRVVDSIQESYTKNANTVDASVVKDSLQESYKENVNRDVSVVDDSCKENVNIVDASKVDDSMHESYTKDVNIVDESIVEDSMQESYAENVNIVNASIVEDSMHESCNDDVNK